MKKKILALAMTACLVVASTMGVTLAWLTSNTGKITNTFTVGDVSISLYEETNVLRASPTSYLDKYETVAADATVSGYKVIPGGKENKSPFVTVNSGSEVCYVFITFKNEFDGITVKDNDGNDVPAVTLNISDELVTGSHWEKKILNDTFVYMFGDNGNYVVSAGYSTRNTTLFDTVEYSKYITKADASNLTGKSIKVKAFAIQSEGVTINEAVNAALDWAKNITW